MVALIQRVREILAVATLMVLLPMSSAIQLEASQFPPEIHLNAGVLHAPPMAVVEELENGELSFAGFQIDLLERLKIFAAEDGVDLHLNLSRAPALYDDAFNLLANDCNTTANPNSQEDCQKYEMIIGDYYMNANRYMRADLSPPWMSSSMATIKYIDKEEGIADYTTLSEAEKAQAAVCLPKGTYLEQVVQDRFPNGQYIHCDPSVGECMNLLKMGNCVLYVYDELWLKYTASQDPSLELTGESFNNQYYVWPMKGDVSSATSRLMKKWMYMAVQNATLDELYNQYFLNGQCPIGTAGENCELPCDPDHGAADTSGICVCKSAKWTGADCSIEVTEDPNIIPSRLIYICYGFAFGNLALVAICGAWVFKNRKRSHIQMAQPMFLAMILVGCSISTSSIFVLAQQDAGDGPVHVCAAIPWLYSIGFSLTFGAMYARIRRIFLVLHYAVELKRVTVTAQETLMTATLVFAIDVVILTVWTIIDPLQWKRTITTIDVFGESLESEGYCTSDHWWVFAGLIALFHFLLMAVALFRCYKARKIPERVSNGKYVAIAMFCNFQIFVVSIPVLIMLGSGNPQTSFFVRSAAICLNDFVVISLVFGDLKYKMYQHDREAEDAVRLSRKSSAHRIKSDLRKYARAMRGFNSQFGRGFRLSTPEGLGESDPTPPVLARSPSADNNGDRASPFHNDKEITLKEHHGEALSKCGDESTLCPSLFHDESTFLGSTIHDSGTGNSARALFDNGGGTSVRALFDQLPGLDETKCEDSCDGDLESHQTTILRSSVVKSAPGEVMLAGARVGTLDLANGEIQMTEPIAAEPIRREPNWSVEDPLSSPSKAVLNNTPSTTRSSTPPPRSGGVTSREVEPAGKYPPLNGSSDGFEGQPTN